ncbi:hypothetical protein Q7P36_009362 [Cladosporium allicinum]
MALRTRPAPRLHHDWPRTAVEADLQLWHPTAMRRALQEGSLSAASFQGIFDWDDAQLSDAIERAYEALQRADSMIYNWRDPSGLYDFPTLTLEFLRFARSEAECRFALEAGITVEAQRQKRILEEAARSRIELTTRDRIVESSPTRSRSRSRRRGAPSFALSQVTLRCGKRLGRTSRAQSSPTKDTGFRLYVPLGRPNRDKQSADAAIPTRSRFTHEIELEAEDGQDCESGENYQSEAERKFKEAARSGKKLSKRSQKNIHRRNTSSVESSPARSMGGKRRRNTSNVGSSPTRDVGFSLSAPLGSPNAGETHIATPPRSKFLGEIEVEADDDEDYEGGGDYETKADQSGQRRGLPERRSSRHQEEDSDHTVVKRIVVR